ncbi:MAG TPA: hypothetical protein VK021_07085 [Flavobacteriaceae bacterium]|nr:hypothetical protein [Flavobacteriaceae bacterium]
MSMALNHSHEMECCTEAERNGKQDMSCCDEHTSDKDNCDSGLCGCPVVTSISAFTANSNKETKFADLYFEHIFPFPWSNIQTPFFQIWSPPDLA